MKRTERNEYNYIRKYEKQFELSYGTTLTIRTDGSAEYKHALHDLYTSWGFNPCSVRVDRTMYDDKERIIYLLFFQQPAQGIHRRAAARGSRRQSPSRKKPNPFSRFGSGFGFFHLNLYH